jgi:glycosyltransferase involved in cell wall biosynthesis
MVEMSPSRLEVNLFVVGDSSDINTWSNLPYFFSNSLIKKGISINRVNIIPEESLIYKYYLRFIQKWFRLKKRFTNRDFILDPFRDKVIRLIVNRKIKCEVKKYSQSDLNIFLTFSYSSYKFIDIPVVHYCDQVYELYLDDTKRKIKKKDIHFINIEKNNLNNSSHIFTTNSKCANFISKRYNLSNVTVLGAGINLENPQTENQENIIKLKKKNKDILFIGKEAYKRGVDILIEAFNRFNRLNDNSFTLHVVGVSKRSFAEINDKIIFYGYLNPN